MARIGSLDYISGLTRPRKPKPPPYGRKGSDLLGPPTPKKIRKPKPPPKGPGTGRVAQLPRSRRGAEKRKARRVVRQVAAGQTFYDPRTRGYGLPKPRRMAELFARLEPAERKRLGPKVVRAYRSMGTRPPETLRRYAPKSFARATRIHREGERERKFDQGSDLVRALEAAAFVVPGGAVVRGAVSAARLARAAKVTGGAARATKTATGARRAARGAAAAARTGARAATFPIRRPIKTAKYTAAAEAPFAISSGDPREAAQRVLEGRGTAASVLRGAGEFVSKAAPSTVAKNLVKDIFELPAVTIPAVYLPIAGVVEAAQGDPERLNALWNDYKEAGLLPALAEGDLDKARRAVIAHPLFSALEARGVQAVVGRGAGAALRRAPSERLRQIGSTERKPLRLRGELAPKPREFSRDIIEKAVQVALDRRRARRQGGQKATPREVERALRERVDRFAGIEEGVRRPGRREQAEVAGQSIGRGVRARVAGRRLSGPEQVGVNLASQGILRSPRTFREDIGRFAQRLDRSHAKLQKQFRKAGTNKDRKLIRDRIRQNRQMVEQLEALAARGNPERIFEAVGPNVASLNKTERGLVEARLLDPKQALQAKLIPFARVHLGAKHRLSNETKAKMQDLRERLEATTNPAEQASIRGQLSTLSQRKQLVDADGNALPPQRLEALAREAGVDPQQIGFVSQSPSARGAGSFYRRFFPDRQTLAGQAKRTGKATVEGTFDPSFDAVAEQMIRGRGIVDATKGFDRMVRELAVTAQRFRNMREARDAVRSPEAHGLPTDLPLTPVRLTPLRATSREVAKAEQLFDRLDPTDVRGMERIVDDLMREATTDGPGPVVLLPEQAVMRMREHFQAATTGRRVAQVLKTGFTTVVLPLSPNWYTGNFVDISLRAMMEGTTIYGLSAKSGRALIRDIERRHGKEAADRVRAAVVPGTLFGSLDRTGIHRDARQFAGTALAPVARAMGTLRRAPGPKQAVDFWVSIRNAAFRFEEHFIERQSQYAILGKAAKQEARSQLRGMHRANRSMDAAMRDVADGLLKTENQIKFAKRVEQTLGQWTGNSPAARQFLVDYAPFGMWARASTKFVLLTLPAKHPIKVGIAAAVAEMTDTERKRLGLSHWAERPLPPNLQGSIPLAGGRLLTPQTITSFGVFADYQRSLADFILPQFPFNELAGFEWTGKKLVREDGTPRGVDERTALAVLAMAEAYVPFFGLGRKFAEGGLEKATPRVYRPYDPELTEYLRGLSESREITVPATSGGDSAAETSEEADFWTGSGGTTTTKETDFWTGR